MMQSEEKMAMKKYNEIENAYMETASERFEKAKKVKTISGIVLAALVLGAFALAVFKIYSLCCCSDATPPLPCATPAPGTYRPCAGRRTC